MRLTRPPDAREAAATFRRKMIPADNPVQPGVALTYRSPEEVQMEMDNVWLERTVRECGEVLSTAVDRVAGVQVMTDASSGC
eukprot:12758-Prorocentrum_minimum.AAC.5